MVHVTSVYQNSTKSWYKSFESDFAYLLQMDVMYVMHDILDSLLTPYISPSWATNWYLELLYIVLIMVNDMLTDG